MLGTEIPSSIEHKIAGPVKPERARHRSDTKRAECIQFLVRGSQVQSLHPDAEEQEFSNFLQAYAEEGHPLPEVRGKPNCERAPREASPGAGRRPQTGRDAREIVHARHKPEVFRPVYVPAVCPAYLLLLPNNNEVYGGAIPIQAKVHDSADERVREEVITSN